MSRFGALVIAGAYSWGRGRSLDLPPRPLAHVGLRPLVTYSLEWLWTGGARHATIAVHGRSAMIGERLGPSFGALPLSYHHDLQPRGAAGCIRDAAATIVGDPIVVVEGSVIPTLSLPRLLERHYGSGAAMTVVTAPETRGGVVRMAGVYVVERRALALVPDHGFQDLKETLIPRLHRAGEAVRVYESTDICRRVVDLASYLSVSYWVIDRTARAAPAPARRAIRGPHGIVVAHETARIDPAAMTIGPVVVGAGARLEPGAIVVGPTAIDDGATVKSGAVVTRAIVGRGATIEGSARVHEAVVGEHARVDAGRQVLNAVWVGLRGRRTWLERVRDRFAGLPARTAPRPRLEPAVSSMSDVSPVAVGADAGASLGT